MLAESLREDNQHFETQSPTVQSTPEICSVIQAVNST